MSREQLSNGSLDPVKRKIQLAGNSTFVVSLPKEWALEQGLESGMHMYLYPHEDRLVAATETMSSQDRAVTIDASTMTGEMVLRRIEGAYIIGCDRISVTELNDTEPQVRRMLERRVNQLIGISIQADTGDCLTIANLLDSSEVSLSQTIAQARQLALEMHEDAITAVLTGDTDLAQRVIERDNDVNRLFAFVSRGFHCGLENVHEINRLGTDRMSAFRDYRIARQLEQIADHAEGIARVTMRQSRSPDQAFADQLETIGADARTIIELSLAGEIQQAHETISAVREAATQIDQELYDRNESDAYLYGRVLQRIRRTAENGINIAETITESHLQE